MNKAILSVSGAFISFLCVVVTLTAFVRSGEEICAILALISGFSVLCFITYGIEDTKVGDYMANFFAGEEDDDE